MDARSGSLSVNIVCQDEEETLSYALHCIERVLSPFLAEVVIVDGGSKDATLFVVKEYTRSLPIVLIKHPYDRCGTQKNRGLDHCTGEYVLDLDADMTFTRNLGPLYASGYFRQHDAWDMGLWFTVLDEFHTFDFPGGGPSLKIFRNDGRRYSNTHHQGMSQPTRVCPEVKIFENSHLQTEPALLKRGQRWQRLSFEIEKEGPPMGDENRYLEAEWWGRHHNRMFDINVLGQIVPRDTHRLKVIDMTRQYEPVLAKGETPQWVLKHLA